MIHAQFLRIFTLVLLFSLGLLPMASMAQRVFEGQVFRKSDESRIAGITVRLQEEKIATSTNDQGFFSLSSSGLLLNDTLVFTGVGFVPLKIAVGDFQDQMQVLLTESTNMLEQVEVGARKFKTERLNPFSFAHIREDPKHSVVTHPYTTPFQYAKLFTAAQENVLIQQIDLGRRNFNPSFSSVKDLTKSNVKTKFKLHIMDVSPKTGAPGKVLFTKDVLLSDKSLMITIDLSKDQILLTDPRFFVAVEWLHIPFNELVKLEYSPKVNKVRKNGDQVLEDVSNYRVIYQPALVEYQGWKPAQSWIMLGNGSWQMNPPSATSKGSDIALSVTIKY